MNLDLGDTREIIDECKARGVLRNQCAYILATTKHETSDTMKPVEEAYYLGEPKASNYRKTLRYYPWYGRGYVQLTWEENYKKAQAKTGALVHDYPERALDPAAAVPILVHGSMEGWFTGKKISDYITLQKSDFYNARRVINGTDKANLIASYAKRYDEALTAEGYGVTDPKPIPKPKAKPKIHKNLLESKELVGGITGLIAAISAFFEKLDGNTIAIILAALALGFIANRLWARYRGDR